MVTQAQVEAAVKAYKAPRLHLNDTVHDREIDMRAALEAVEALAEYEYGWSGDAQAGSFYDSREAAEEYMGNPKQFRRRRAGPWKEVTDG